MRASRIVPILLTIVALAAGYGLWILSAEVVDWTGGEALLPIIRLAVIVAGVCLAEYLLDFFTHLRPFRAGPTGDGHE